ncbi:metallophosphoesterase MPPED2a isoform X2 [Pristis pectinata]|uniref:metallophosphoesterase MPPED2a isoform X2 n=1 Tax=Pristis pectinata TaxID=685728 RepID=UPI00223DB305|nr:metallophosphoesterase MPPED2a isoform X2 [Pristis pectinata]
MDFVEQERMAHGIPSQGKITITVDEYSSNPTQAFTHYNINQSRFQPPHVHMVDPIPYDTPKPAGHTRFVCVSDTHSRTDGIQMPYGDILLHTGDFTELGLPTEVKKFNDWLGTLPYEYKIVIAGNHELTFDKDFIAELVKQDYYRFPSVSKLKPEDFDNVQSLLTNCIYVQDSEVTVKGFQIYGTPWCTIESIPSRCITALYDNCSAQDRKKLRRVVNTAQRITQTNLPSIDSVYTSRCLRQAANIIEDPSHPGHSLFSPLPSGRKSLCLKARTTTLKDSFYPAVIRLLNGPCIH